MCHTGWEICHLTEYIYKHNIPQYGNIFAISACSSPGTHSINPAQSLRKAEGVDFNSNDFQLVLVQVVRGHTVIENMQSVMTTGSYRAESSNGTKRYLIFALGDETPKMHSVPPGLSSVRASSMAAALPLQSITTSIPQLRSLARQVLR